jgi:hypothetical protein
VKGLGRLAAGSVVVVVGVIVGGTDGVADSLWVRFDIFGGVLGGE